MHMTLTKTGMFKTLEVAKLLYKPVIVLMAVIAMTLSLNKTILSVKETVSETQTVAGYIRQQIQEKETWEQRVKRLVDENLQEIDRAGGIAKIKDQQVLCLAQNVYFESRGQPLAGQVGVAKVTLNRLDEGYARTVCGVVKQKLVADVCQFSWVCEGSGRKPVGYDWRLAIGIAMATLQDGEHIQDPTNGATHFHATYVRPDWSRVYARAQKIGDHIFYKPKNK